MPKKDNSYDIERFGDRVNWMARRLRHKEGLRLPTGTSPDVHRAIEELGHKIRGIRSWNRYSSGKTPVPHEVVAGVLDVFPDLTEEMVVCPSYADFEHLGEALTRTFERWEGAVQCLANERTTLATIAKAYYVSAGVDESPTFPLVARKEWILPKPVPMTPSLPVATFRRGEAPPDPVRLDGLNINYAELKARWSPRRPTDGDSYRLMDIRRVGESLEFDFQDTSYFAYINTCEILGIELADQYLAHNAARASGSEAAWTPDKADLPRRGAPSDILDFRNRAAFAGVNCLLMIKGFFKGDDGRRSDKFFIHRRTEKTLEAQNTLHVVPAGGHQPCEEAFGNRNDVSIWRTVVREFCEELFSKEEATSIKRTGEDFLERQEVQGQIKAFFSSGAAQPHLLGVGLDPLTTKPELLVAIVIDWPAATRAGGKADLEIVHNYEGDAIPLDLSRESLREVLDHPPGGKPWLPAGRACIELAIDHYDFLMRADA